MAEINRISLPLEGKSAVFPYEDTHGPLFSEGIFNQYKVLLGDFGYMKFE